MKTKTFKIIVFLLLTMFLFSCTQTTTVTVKGNQTKSFQAEIADTLPTQAKGLMFRKSLEENKGMLFVFPSSRYRTFWMMNTTIPLDIIFIDENQTVINIEAARPCGIIPCHIYKSAAPARYVLEINQNLSQKYGFQPGSKVEFDLK